LRSHLTPGRRGSSSMPRFVRQSDFVERS